MRHAIVPLAVMAIVGIAFGTAGATNTIKNAWLVEYPEACALLIDSANDCSLCHVSGGFALNPYGTDLAAAGGVDFSAIENMDSDTDGRTNLEEITIDCTLPGDAASPANEDTWTHVKALFR